VFENPNAAEREDAVKILAWIICSKRPLRWREIQAIFSIDPKNATVDFESRSLLVTAKELCGSLVDIRTLGESVVELDEVIDLVHDTAKE
jgi:hypothetical protein